MNFKHIVCKLLLTLLSLLNLIVAPLAMILFGFWACLLIPFGKNGDLVMSWGARPWGLFTLALARLPVTVEGLEHLDTNKSYIFMPNHASFYDVPLIVSKVPFNLRTMAKTMFFHIPFFGFAMSQAHNIKIYRHHPRKDIKQLELAESCLAQGISIVAFPEGTRTHNGKLQPLKSGLFILPIKTGVPVVPVVIKNTYKILPTGSLWMRRHPIVLRFLPPIDSASYDRQDRERFAEDVYQALKNELEQEDSKQVAYQ